MKNEGTIILVEDDKDDIDILIAIISELSAHEVIVFSNLGDAFEHIHSASSKPFIVLCDNNWRNKNLASFKKQLQTFPDLKIKSIPFIFYSSALDEEQVTEAFEDLNVQGYFQKGNSYDEIKKDMAVILNYWERSGVPVVAKN